MKRTKSSLFTAAVLYCVLAFIANFFTSAVALLCVEKLVLFLVTHTDLNASWLNSISMSAMAILDLAMVIGITAVFARAFLAPLYEDGGGSLWLKKSALIILPGEAVRYLYALSDLGFVDRSGRFAAVPSCLFELLYLKDPNRHLAIRQYGEYVLADYAFYTLCYALYSAVLLGGVFWVCRMVWNKYGKDYADLV